jgi:hypothetical protein
MEIESSSAIFPIRTAFSPRIVARSIIDRTSNDARAKAVRLEKARMSWFFKILEQIHKRFLQPRMLKDKAFFQQPRWYATPTQQRQLRVSPQQK